MTQKQRIPIGNVPSVIGKLGYPEPALKTVYGWAARNKLRVTRVGGKLYTTLQDIRRFLNHD
jgi:hypothetical protein